MKNTKWKSYAIEFLSIFVAVIAAFALNNWNENRRDRNAESKILSEISIGLKKDIEDIRVNAEGHKRAMKSCMFWRAVMQGKEVTTDSVAQNYFDLTRDFISMQNVSGYEALKSKGLELVTNDSLRSAIISLYEYDYNILKKLEEEYYEMQFHVSYFREFNDLIAPYLQFNDQGNIVGMELPFKLSEADKNIMLTYLWKIEGNRNFIRSLYQDVEKNNLLLIDLIERVRKRI